MKFLTSGDIRLGIQDPFYQAISDDDDTIKFLSESVAIAKVKSALAQRYDVEAIFAAEEEARDPLIVHHVLVIFIYNLYQRFDPRKIPENRKENYHETLDFLDDVLAGKRTLDLPKKETGDKNTGDVFFSSPPKRDYSL